MNKHLQNLKKLEFVITYSCTGRCRHCSEGGRVSGAEHIDPVFAADAVIRIAAEYRINEVMTFGGEPLLYPQAVFGIHRAARDAGVDRRVVITNGYFTKDADHLAYVADGLSECGVNDILLSVDAFHQETIPVDAVRNFASMIQSRDIPIRVQPAWLVSSDHDNPYNNKTRELLRSFHGMGIRENEGNVVFCEGNAKKYLSEYFIHTSLKNPYIEDPRDLRCLSFGPGGELFGSNIYSKDVMDILCEYKASDTDVSI